jgi:hypothetical protein
VVSQDGIGTINMVVRTGKGAGPGRVFRYMRADKEAVTRTGSTTMARPASQAHSWMRLGRRGMAAEGACDASCKPAQLAAAGSALAHSPQAGCLAVCQLLATRDWLPGPSMGFGAHARQPATTFVTDMLHSRPSTSTLSSTGYARKWGAIVQLDSRPCFERAPRSMTRLRAL